MYSMYTSPSVETGVKRAKDQEQWVGNIPAGFRRYGGYLQPIVEPGRGEDSYRFWRPPTAHDYTRDRSEKNSV
jgi:hypothetical protein